MQKVLIADTNKLLVSALAKTLSGSYDVHTCDTSLNISTTIESIRPDILVLSLHLHGVDSFSVLRSCKHIPPRIIALTMIVTPTIEANVLNHGISHLVLLPCTIKYLADLIKKPLHQPELMKG